MASLTVQSQLEVIDFREFLKKISKKLEKEVWRHNVRGAGGQDKIFGLKGRER